MLALGAILPRVLTSHSPKAAAAGVEAGTQLTRAVPSAATAEPVPVAAVSAEPADELVSEASAPPPATALVAKPMARNPNKPSRAVPKAPAKTAKSSGSDDLLAPDYAR
jgi:outer membrane biosynthesis protein TonB